MNKIILTTATILASLTIAGCTNNTVASSTAGKISQDELYEAMKSNVGSTTLQQLLIKDVLTEKYGETITDKKVNAEYKKQEESYGGADAFKNVLASSGFTDASYKDTIRLNLLIEEAVKKNSKFTDEEIKAAYDAYTPPMTVAHILVADEAKAKELITELNDGADFATLAKENSTDTSTAEKGGELTFSTGEVAPEFEEAASKLEEGKITPTPVKSEFGYHIIKLTEKSEKGALKEERKTIEEQLLQEKLADSATVQSTLSEIIQDANINIDDEDLSTAMDTYLKKPETSTKSSEKVESSADSESAK
ncbi:foldase protein PrsA [Carnobacterium iners]|uniref:Foldase protein PrsA n=1 Tax=Carnobacterium iners TaxID=1073423 RepID=A0A1X7NRA9_9LACT|nr:peptidylprolyl isomerase [Carnobacterium iners]SEK26988.1 foldase protein PrsA [Carnobacterium iners]SMH40167.1 foldase protein PrsA [Carnobacterium iners]